MRIEPFLKQSPMFQVNRISRQMGASLKVILECEELTAVESLILAALFFEKKCAIKPSHLARTFQTTRGNVSHCLSSLEAKGLVERKIDPDDARAFRLTLRSRGRQQAIRVIGILDRLQRHFEERIGAANLQAMLEQMSAVEKLCSELSTSSVRPRR